MTTAMMSTRTIGTARAARVTRVMKLAKAVFEIVDTKQKRVDTKQKRVATADRWQLAVVG